MYICIKAKLLAMLCVPYTALGYDETAVQERKRHNRKKLFNISSNSAPPDDDIKLHFPIFI